jgi:hypothetical protein
MFENIDRVSIPFGTREVSGSVPIPFAFDRVSRFVTVQDRRYYVDIVRTDSRGTLVNGRTFEVSRDQVNAFTNRYAH